MWNVPPSPETVYLYLKIVGGSKEAGCLKRFSLPHILRFLIDLGPKLEQRRISKNIFQKRLALKKIIHLKIFLSSYIATKMSWASRRQTTRPEDMSYCFLSIFGVLTLIQYGEGQYTFIRLQKFLLSETPDESISYEGVTSLVASLYSARSSFTSFTDRFPTFATCQSGNNRQQKAKVICQGHRRINRPSVYLTISPFYHLSDHHGEDDTHSLLFPQQRWIGMCNLVCATRG